MVTQAFAVVMSRRTLLLKDQTLDHQMSNTVGNHMSLARSFVPPVAVFQVDEEGKSHPVSSRGRALTGRHC